MRSYAQAFVFISQPIVIVSLAFVFNSRVIAFKAQAILIIVLMIVNVSQEYEFRLFAYVRCV